VIVVAPKPKSEPKKFKDEFWKTKDIKISIRDIVEKDGEREVSEEETPIGPTPKPHVTDLRSWDMKLLSRYEPFYAPFCDMCCLCTFGKCDLLNKKGACGINSEAQQARIVLLACNIGTAAHAGHARHLVHHLIDELGEDYPLDLGLNIDIEAPITKL
jgi:acetyl-CoA decarbonylase/synthase complex subunit alpha